METSNHDKPEPNLYCLHYNECDPKKCTALKLKKLNLIKIIRRIEGKLKKAVILTPFSEKELSLEDRDTILHFGLIVIDCSWKNILNLKRISKGIGRKLPSLIAVNPINYGKWGKLSSVEALAAALIVTEFDEYATRLLGKFSWGEEFYKLNKFKKKEIKKH